MTQVSSARATHRAMPDVTEVGNGVVQGTKKRSNDNVYSRVYFIHTHLQMLGIVAPIKPKYDSPMVLILLCRRQKVCLCLCRKDVLILKDSSQVH